MRRARDSSMFRPTNFDVCLKMPSLHALDEANMPPLSPKKASTSLRSTTQAVASSWMKQWEIDILPAELDILFFSTALKLLLIPS
jgi:hypothetical protein